MGGDYFACRIENFSHVARIFYVVGHSIPPKQPATNKSGTSVQGGALLDGGGPLCGNRDLRAHLPALNVSTVVNSP